MLRSNLCDYVDAYIFDKRTITVESTTAASAAADNVNKKVIFKDFVPFSNCISRIKTAQVDDAYTIDVVLSMYNYNYNSYSDDYSKIFENLWQYCRDQPALANNGDVTDFNKGNVTSSFDIKEKIGSQAGSNGTQNIKTMVPLRYLSNLWGTLEMPLTNCEVNLDLKWSKNYVIVATNLGARATTFSITDTKLFVPVVTWSTQDNTKLLEQLKCGFKRTVNWKKYQSKISTETQNQYLDYLTDPRFQEVNKVFILSFENESQETSYKEYYFPTVEIKDYNIIIDGQILFQQPVEYNLTTYNSNQKIVTV